MKYKKILQVLCIPDYIIEAKSKNIFDYMYVAAIIILGIVDIWCFTYIVRDLIKNIK